MKLCKATSYGVHLWLGALGSCPLCQLGTWFDRFYDCYLLVALINIVTSWHAPPEFSWQPRLKRKRSSLRLICRDITVNCVSSFRDGVFISSFVSLLILFSRQQLCSSFHMLFFSSRRPPSSSSSPPAVLWDVMMLWQAWRLFLEVLIFLCHSGGGWYRNSTGVVVYTVGVRSREGWEGLRSVRF